MKHRPGAAIRGLSVFAVVVRVSLGCLFLWSGMVKIRMPYDFLSDVYNYELVGPRLGMFVAMTLPWFELIVGACLLGGLCVTGALLGSMAMAAAFTFAISWAVYHGLSIGCGCFGSGGLVGYGPLARAIIIFWLSGAAYFVEVFMNPRIFARSHGSQRSGLARVATTIRDVVGRKRLERSAT